MCITNRLGTILALAGLLVWIPGPAAARTKTGDRFFSEGFKAERLKQYDKAVELYQQALAEDSSDVGYRLAYLRVRFQASQKHLELGQNLRSQAKLQEAASEFDKALAIDPSSPVAIQEVQRTREMIEGLKKEPKTESEKLERKGFTPAEAARKEVETMISTALTVPELKPLLAAPITLKINNTPKVVFETIGKLAGVNVLFDTEYQQPGQAPAWGSRSPAPRRPRRACTVDRAGTSTRR